MFNTSEVKNRPSVKGGINVNVDVESVFAPLKADGTGDPVLQIRIKDTNVKKVFWSPKQEGNKANRACPYNFEFGGQKGQKGVEMTDEVANALEMYDFVRTTKQVLSAAGYEGEVVGSSYEEFSKNFVAAVPSFKADVKAVYGSTGYLEIAKSGFIASPNSNKLTVTANDKVVKEVNPDMTSAPTADDSLPF